MSSFEALVDHIDQPGIDADPALDIVKLKPEITLDEALRVQLAVKRRRVSEGDRIVGHQGSFTSEGIRKIFPDAPRPMVGTLLASMVREDGDEIAFDAEQSFVESEFAVLLGRDLEGPAVTAFEALSAAEAFFPAIEIAPLRPLLNKQRYSWAHSIAVQKAKGGYVIFGPRLTSTKGLDPRLEGCLVSIDGQPRAAAAGFESMGDPMRVVAAIARGLHAAGEKLHAGQIVMTGTLAPPQVVGPGIRNARVEFQSLGAVNVRFASGS